MYERLRLLVISLAPSPSLCRCLVFGDRSGFPLFLSKPRCLVFGDRWACRFFFCRNPEDTVFEAWRLIGRKFADPIVQSDIKLWCGPSKLKVKSLETGEVAQISTESSECGHVSGLVSVLLSFAFPSTWLLRKGELKAQRKLVFGLRQLKVL